MIPACSGTYILIKIKKTQKKPQLQWRPVAFKIRVQTPLARPTLSASQSPHLPPTFQEDSSAGLAVPHTFYISLQFRGPACPHPQALVGTPHPPHLPGAALFASFMLAFHLLYYHIITHLLHRGRVFPHPPDKIASCGKATTLFCFSILTSPAPGTILCKY